MTTIAIVEPKPLIREALRLTFAEAPDLDVVGVYPDLTSLMSAAMREAQVVVMGLSGTDLFEGLADIEALKQADAQVRVLLLSDVSDPAVTLRAREAGVNAIARLDVSPAGLGNLVRTVAAGYNAFLDFGDSPSPLEGLTDQEELVLRYACTGLSRKEISEALYLSDGTVKRHVSHILAKTGYTSLHRLVIDLVAKGLVEPALLACPA